MSEYVGMCVKVCLRVCTCDVIQQVTSRVCPQYSRFWCVQRVGAVAHILGAVEHTVGQTSQEITRR